MIDLRKKALLAVVVATLVVAMAGCSSSSKSASTTTTSTSTTAGNKSFEVTTADGQVSLSLDGNLPPGWPQTFPVPDGASPAGSGSLVKGESGKLVAVFTSTGTPQDAYTFYRDSTAITVDDSSAGGIGPAYLGTVKFSGSSTGRVTVLSKGGATTIVIVLDSGSTDTGSSDTGSSDTGSTDTTAAA